jgi:hypothetical protein
MQAAKNSNGSLVIGGFDQSRLADTYPTFEVNQTSTPLLGLQIVSMIATGTFNNIIAMPVGEVGLPVMIESTVSELWLPRTVCDSLEQVFGLYYDANTSLYLVNITSQNTLMLQSPQLTITLAQNGSPQETVNIVLPHSAPVYNRSAIL